MSIVIYVITVCEGHEHGILPLLFSLTSLIELHIPARALRALGLLLADGAPTVGWKKTLWRICWFALQRHERGVIGSLI